MTMLVISILLASEFLGLFPNKDKSGLTERKFIVETLAVHVAMELDGEQEKISEMLRTTVTRNPFVESVAVRRANGLFIDAYGSHQENWTLTPDQQSTPTQVQVPLFEGNRQIATVEIRFKQLNDSLNTLESRDSFTSVVLFVALSAFAAFCMFLKRTLRELDPDAVIPERVRKALDTLAEGLLIINRDNEIVFSNAAFARTTGLAATELSGKSCDSLKWQTENESEPLPWIALINGGDMSNGATVKLQTGYEQISTFTVNATPIVAGADEIRGALVTFNDITEVEIKNAELRNALVKLEKSQLEITRQNEELEYLATRDPLTGSLNRRSFFNGFDTLFAEARQNQDELTCIMVDIDHFKSVNDTHGHGVGDEVIKYLANVLAEHSRPNDLVARFGGEEFCIVMPATSISEGAVLAETLRSTIENGISADFLDKCRITASFGVASIHSGAEKPNDMVEQADKALYYSKENGRNQVANFKNSMDDPKINIPASAPSPAPALATPILKPVARPATVPVLSYRTPGKNLDGLNSITGAGSSIVADVRRKESGVPVLALKNTKPSNHKGEPLTKSGQKTVDTGALRLERNLLLDRIDQALQHALRKNQHVGVFLLSIDALQKINDTLGFSVSEKLYQKITTRLKETLRDETNIGLVGAGEHSIAISRYGDTEICLVLHDIKRVSDFAIINERIIDGFNHTISVDGHEIFVALDTGVSIFPNHGTEADALIRNASIAMREARDTSGQNNIVFYSPDMNQTSRKLIRLETELHQALSRNELFVCYQPKINLRTGHIVSMEALVRWKHPEFGIVSPGEFIPLAERTGLINQISAWITRVVCAQIAMWCEAGHKNLSVAVNMSPVEMRNEQLADNILNAIREFAIPPGKLEVEITESLVMQDMNQAIRTLEKLDRNGVEISIDDFGTGFASLSYLKLFPISKVKIDRSFVSDFATNPEDARIVSGVIAMSHSLGCKVVCEGVENEDQLRFLQDHHCDEVQGNLLSLPLQRQEATNLLANPRRIRRMITSYNVSELGLTAMTSAGTQTVITGVLNAYPDDINIPATSSTAH